MYTCYQYSSSSGAIRIYLLILFLKLKVMKTQSYEEVNFGIKILVYLKRKHIVRVKFRMCALLTAMLDFVELLYNRSPSSAIFHHVINACNIYYILLIPCR